MLTLILGFIGFILLICFGATFLIGRSDCSECIRSYNSDSDYWSDYKIHIF